MDAVVRRAAAIQSLGLNAGETAGLMLGNGPSLYFYHLAAKAVGVRTLLLDPSQPAETSGVALQRAHARVLFASDGAQSYAAATQLLAFSMVERVVVVPLASQVSTLSAVGLMLGAGDRLARVAATPGGPVVREGDLLRGSTAGSPSGLSETSISGDGISANVEQVLTALPELTPGTERLVAAVPLSDALMLNLVSGIGLARAAEVVIPDSLEPADIARALGRQGGAVLLTSRARLSALIQYLGAYAQALRDLKFCVLAGGVPTARLLEAYAGATGRPLRFVFSARGRAAAIGEAEAQGDGAAAGVCRPLDATQFSVRDLAERGREVPRGERGALYVSGPQYEGGAFAATGDVGLIDPSGHLVVIDRIDELVVAAGYMIYPRRIEAALLEFPGVAEAAVVGVSDGKRGMAPKAFVVLARGAAVTERDLMKHLGERISKIELPADIDFCTSLPRDAFGEVDRRALRDTAG